MVRIGNARAAALNDQRVCELDLKHCHLAEHDSEWIQSLLQTNTVLTEIDLSRNSQLGDKVAEAIAHVCLLLCLHATCTSSLFKFIWSIGFSQRFPNGRF